MPSPTFNKPRFVVVGRAGCPHIHRAADILESYDSSYKVKTLPPQAIEQLKEEFVTDTTPLIFDTEANVVVKKVDHLEQYLDTSR